MLHHNKYESHVGKDGTPGTCDLQLLISASVGENEIDSNQRLDWWWGRGLGNPPVAEIVNKIVVLS